MSVEGSARQRVPEGRGSAGKGRVRAGAAGPRSQSTKAICPWSGRELLEPRGCLTAPDLPSAPRYGLGPAAGIGGAGEPRQPASLQGGGRGAPLPTPPPWPHVPLFPSLFPLLPFFSPSFSSAVWFLRAPGVPRPPAPGTAPAGSAAGQRSLGRPRAQDGRAVGEARGPREGKPRPSGARRKLLSTRLRPCRLPPASLPVLGLRGGEERQSSVREEAPGSEATPAAAVQWKATRDLALRRRGP